MIELDKKSMIIGLLIGVLVFSWIYIVFLGSLIGTYQRQIIITQKFTDYMTIAMDNANITTKLLLVSQEQYSKAVEGRLKK